MAAKTAAKKKYTHTKKELPTLPKWEELLRQAVNEPGLISECYHMFHDYSPGNQMLAMWQCMLRKVEPGPIATYNAWKALGRHVKGHEKALYLCRPVSWSKDEPDPETGEPVKVGHVAFRYEPRWFVLSQTEGEDYVPPELPGFDIGEAIVRLEVEPVPFTMTDGNCMGYASGRTFAVNPLNKHAMATTMHELAHIVLKHTEELVFTDTSDRTPRDVREMEAECTALIILDQLGEKDHAESRGYIQGWYKGNEVPEESARKIFTAADKILKAGRGL